MEMYQSCMFCFERNRKSENALVNVKNRLLYPLTITACSGGGGEHAFKLSLSTGLGFFKTKISTVKVFLFLKNDYLVA